MKPSVPIVLLAVSCLTAGCLTTTPKHPTPPVSSEMTSLQHKIALRKARKYGVDPNYLRAILILEQRKSERLFLQSAEGCEWALENAARVVAFLSSEPRTVNATFYSYASGRKARIGQADEKAARFAQRAERLYRKLEKELPWPKPL